MANLNGAVALVTGATGGIGSAVVRRLAADGAKIAVHHLDDEGGAREMVEDLGRTGSAGFAVQADLRNPADIRRMVRAAAEHYGRLDILVNVVATGAWAPLGEITEDAYADIFNTNARGTLFVMQEALPHLKPGGRIINFSTGAVITCSPGMMLYAASKAAIEIMTKVAANELGPKGITVNAVMPGSTRTKTFMALSDEALRAWSIASSALRRLGEPEDIADIVAFLASDDARWVTGQIIHATGGLV